MYTYRNPSPSRLVCLTLLVFAVIYNVAPLGHESLTSARFGVAIMLMWATIEGRNYFKLLNTKAWLLFLPLPVVVAQYILVPDFGQLSRFLHLAFYSVLGAALFCSLVRDPKFAIQVSLAAISLQALILLFSFFSSSYRIWFDSTVSTGSNYGADYIYRAPGLSSDGGAALSVVQSLGVLLGWLLLRPNPTFSSVSGWRAAMVYAAMVLSAASCVVVGRTGVLMSTVFFVLVLLTSVGQRGVILMVALGVSIAYILFNIAMTEFAGSEFSLDYFSGWAFGIFSGNDETVQTLAAMNVPPLTSKTFFGTGLSSVVDGVNPSGNDSGFIQAYYSMGLPFSIMLYAAYLFVLLYILKWLPVRSRIVIAAVMFCIEAKEPFLFKYATMFLLMILHFSHLHFGARSTSVSTS